MRVKSLSATALEAAKACPARFKAAHVDKIPSPSGVPAMIGTSVHGALEAYVGDVYIEKKMEPSLDLLKMHYAHSFMVTFGYADDESPEYKDGLELCEKWFDRHDLDEDHIEVISVEIKKSFPVKVQYTDKKTGVVTDEEVPVNYIIDRVDKIGPRIIRVVDYKTQRVPLTLNELRRKIQAKLYALAIAIEYKGIMEIDEIHVQFDYLRKNDITFAVKRAENKEFYKELLKMAQKIADEDDENPARKVNADCQYCPIKVTCGELQRIGKLGGIASLSIEKAALLYEELTAKSKAIKYALEEIDALLVNHAVNEDVLEFNAGAVDVEMTMRRNRGINMFEAAKVIGPVLMARYGKLNIGEIDKLLKGNELTDKQKEELSALIYTDFGDPKAKIVPAKAPTVDMAVDDFINL